MREEAMLERRIVLRSDTPLAKYIIRKLKVVGSLPFIDALIVEGESKYTSRLDGFPLVGVASMVKVNLDKVRLSLRIDGITQKGWTGLGQTVAVIDTGIKPHLDFMMPFNRIATFVDLLGDKVNAYDDCGHGTAVSGILCGNGLKSCGKYSGIAPRAKVCAIKAIDESGKASSIEILRAMQWIFDNHKKYNIGVVCMSFGAEAVENDPLKFGVDTLWGEGIVVVASSGNSGPDSSTIMSPGVSSRIITVGGADTSGKDFAVAPFSSRGPVGEYIKPDVVAPAVDITCPYITSDYIAMSGTSMACPIVAGVCALLRQKYPHFTADKVKDVIMKHAQIITGDRNSEGSGLIDLSFLETDIE